MFYLPNKEFTFDVDVSKLPCGLNGALYFVEMEESGGSYPTNTAGASYGTGYCDAQCPHDMKWINGEANAEGNLQAFMLQKGGEKENTKQCSHQKFFRTFLLFS